MERAIRIIFAKMPINTKFWKSSRSDIGIQAILHKIVLFQAKIVSSEQYMPDDDFKKLLASAGKLKKRH